MAPKTFLIVFAIVYVIVALALNIVLGPPTYTREFLDAHKGEHDRYIDTIKSDAYKLWSENAALNPPDEALSENIAFVEAYEAADDFVAETARRAKYDTITDVFNAGMLILLVVVLARGPAMKFIDASVDQVRTQIETLEQNRSEAARRKKESAKKLENIDQEREASQAQVQQRIAAEAARIEELTRHALELLAQETEDRKRQEELMARQALKASMVDAALKELEGRYRDERSDASESALIDQFVADLGAES